MAPRSLPEIVAGGSYERAWLRPDLLAGLTVAAMVVPQAMAYAELGGLEPSAGFRAILVALPIYALLGTSRHLGVGPEPGTAVLAAVAVAPLAGGDPDRYLALMAALAGMVGALGILGGLLRLGFVANLLSKPVLVGYITGVGLTLLSSQLASFTGVPIDADSFFPRFGEFFTRLDQTDSATIGVGIVTLAIIMGLRRYRPALPGALIGLAVTITAVAVADLDVALVGQIEAALPTPGVPDIAFADLADLAPAAAGLLLIGYTDNILTARSIAAKERYDIDPNRELFALGGMNAATAFGGGFPMSSSASRSFVPASLGSRSQMSAVFTFAAVVVFLLVGQPLLERIPRPALAAVVIAAAFAVIDIEGFRRLARIDRTETALAAVTALAVITTDLLTGVLLAVALSAVITLGRVARPHDAILGEGSGLDGWIDVADERAQTLPGLMVYRFDAPLFFGNVGYFEDRIELLLEQNPGPERHVVLDLEGIGSIDTTAVEELIEIVEALHTAGIGVSLARGNSSVLGVIERSGLAELVGSEHIHPTINAAVAAFRRRYP
ncbi:MAG: SulP family inorganic anion transporter [Acidimicrobiales bacterium]